MKKLLGEKGVALMLVLTAIAVLTTAVTEFAYNTNVTYHLARNERDRAMAYYLAESAQKFMLLELKFDRMYRSMISRYNLGQYLGAAVQQPLCQQFPMSTGLIREVFVGGGLSGLIPGSSGEENSGEGENNEETTSPEEAPKEETNQMVSMSQKEGATEFLDFNGDFEASCLDESTKLSLNGFYELNPNIPEGGKMSPLDNYKILLINLLKRPEYKDLFLEGDPTPDDVVDNIADYIDADEMANKKGGTTGGTESSIYTMSGSDYPIRNGKLLTLNEAYLIEGVKTRWFEPVSERLTVYGEGKINPCTADSSLVDTMIRNYIINTTGLPPIKIDDPEEMTRIMTSMMDACDTGSMGDTLIQEVANGFITAVGVLASGELTPKMVTDDFKKMFLSEARFFRLDLKGIVEPITINVESVIDIKDSDPKKWKLLYWRVY